MNLKLPPALLSYIEERLATLSATYNSYTPKKLARQLTKMALTIDSETAIITCQLYEINKSTPDKGEQK